MMPLWQALPRKQRWRMRAPQKFANYKTHKFWSNLRIIKFTNLRIIKNLWTNARAEAGSLESGACGYARGYKKAMKTCQNKRGARARARARASEPGGGSRAGGGGVFICPPRPIYTYFSSAYLFFVCFRADPPCSFASEQTRPARVLQSRAGDRGPARGERVRVGVGGGGCVEGMGLVGGGRGKEGWGGAQGGRSIHPSIHPTIRPLPPSLPPFLPPSLLPCV